MPTKTRMTAVTELVDSVEQRHLDEECQREGDVEQLGVEFVDGRAVDGLGRRGRREEGGGDGDVRDDDDGQGEPASQPGALHHLDSAHRRGK
jgi:hypothetical protein